MAHMGATQFAGGGFLPTGAGGMGTQKRSMGEGADPSADSLRNLTVRQLTKAQHDGCNSAQDLECDGKVAMVGQLTSKVITDNETTFHVWDGSGTIACRAFHDGNDTVAQASELHEGTYIQVYGNFKGGLAENPGALGPITVFHFEKVEDFNQVVHHQLSVTFQHMYLEKKQSIGENAYGQAGAGAPGMAMGGMQAGAVPLQQQGGFTAGVNEAQAVDIIAQWLKEQPQTPDNSGYRQEQIIAGLAGQLPPDMVLAGLKYGIETSARLYNTVDDQTFSSI